MFAATLAGLLVGYMFMGRGFAHIRLGPVFIGDGVLFLGMLTAVVAILRWRARAPLTWTVTLLIAFMALGAIRTLPYLGTYGMDALRDGALWGYAAFALIVYLLADRPWLRAASRAYGRILPVFAVWLPISLAIFTASQVGIDATRPGSNTPLVFFKAGDMAVQAVGAVAFLVLAPGALAFLWAASGRFLVAVPLSWTVFVAGAANRGAILAAATGLALAAILVRRRVNWAPVIAAAIIVVVGLNSVNLLGEVPGPFPTPSASESPGQTEPSSSPTRRPMPPPSGAPTLGPTDEPGRQFSVQQWMQNLGSIFGSSNIGELDGTRAFRLAWWGKIVDYTIFGPYFWSGKGFGVNLADVDGFQPTADQSLRAPHNTHMTVLARMGVPGAILWLLFQGFFVVGLVRAVWRHRRTKEPGLAALGAWVLVVWGSMMVVTAFDPYLEGPQGGIWYWVVVGLGLTVTRMARRPEAT